MTTSRRWRVRGCSSGDAEGLRAEYEALDVRMRVAL